MNVIEKTTGDKAISNWVLQFLWLAVATVAATYAVYLDVLETGAEIRRSSEVRECLGQQG